MAVAKSINGAPVGANDFSPRLDGIALRDASRGEIREVEAATVTVAGGLAGDYHQRGMRQITVLFADAWAAACHEAGAVLPWTARRANLLLSGMTMADCKGTRLQIGANMVLEVSGETAPCHVMEALHAGLRDGLKPAWRGGLTCFVIKDGTISVGDAVKVLQPV